MVVVFIILLLVLLVLIVILLTPLVVTIDSVRQVYEIRLWYLAHADLKLIEDEFIIDLTVLGFNKGLGLYNKKKKPAKPGKTKIKKKKSRRSFSVRSKVNRGQRVLQSFNVKQFRLDLDTDDYCYNAFMYPIFFLARTEKYQLNINYSGVKELHLVLINRPIRILSALIF